MKPTSLPDCPYCLTPSVQVSGGKLYPSRKELHGKIYFHCGKCDARVGCHPGTNIPLGSLATRELRIARRRTHVLLLDFMKFFQATRHESYAWISQELSIPLERCHVGMFRAEDCRRAINAMQKMMAGHKLGEVEKMIFRFVEP